VISVGSTLAAAVWKRDQENWLDLQNDFNDASGSAASAWEYICNYDCNANPIVLP
jgi:hypothetical protein